MCKSSSTFNNLFYFLKPIWKYIMLFENDTRHLSIIYQKNTEKAVLTLTFSKS